MWLTREISWTQLLRERHCTVKINKMTGQDLYRCHAWLIVKSLHKYDKHCHPTKTCWHPSTNFLPLHENPHWGRLQQSRFPLWMKSKSLMKWLCRFQTILTWCSRYICLVCIWVRLYHVDILIGWMYTLLKCRYFIKNVFDTKIILKPLSYFWIPVFYYKMKTWTSLLKKRIDEIDLFNRERNWTKGLN